MIIKDLGFVLMPSLYICLIMTSATSLMKLFLCYSLRGSVNMIAVNLCSGRSETETISTVIVVVIRCDVA